MSDGPTALVGEMAAWLAGAPPQPKVHASSLSPNVAQLLLVPQVPLSPSSSSPSGVVVRLTPPRIFAVAEDGTLVTLLAAFSRAALTAGCADSADDADPAALERVCAHAAARLRALCLDPALFPPVHQEQQEQQETPTELVADVLRDSVELERLLRCVHAAAATADAAPPGALLRDLLAAPPVRHALGADCAFLATLLCGVPCGLNLRNVAWHGFAAPHELAPAHAALLRTLADTAHAWLVAHTAPLPAPPSALPEATGAPFGVFVVALQRACGDGGGAETLEDAVHALVRASRFVCWDREAHVAALLAAALEAFFGGDAGTAGRALGVLLPQLEHALRRVYVAANALPPRVLAPDYRRYYTTLEIVLQPAVVVRAGQLVARSAAAGTRFCRPKFGRSSHDKDEDKEDEDKEDEDKEDEEEWERPNRLADVLGAGTTMLLRDCLAHAAGPRLRDRAAHGTADPATAPRALVAALLCAFLRLCVRFCAAPESPQHARWAPVVAAVDAHVARFHPARVCHTALVRAATAVAEHPLLAPAAAALLAAAASASPDSPLCEYAVHAQGPPGGCAACENANAALADARAQDGVRTRPAHFFACTPARLGAVQQLARVATRAAACHGALTARVAALVAAVHGGTARRRAQDSCYRALAARHVWEHALRGVCARALAGFAGVQRPVRAAARCEALLSRVPALCAVGAWDRLSATLTDAAEAMDGVSTDVSPVCIDDND